MALMAGDTPPADPGVKPRSSTKRIVGFVLLVVALVVTGIVVLLLLALGNLGRLENPERYATPSPEQWLLNSSDASRPGVGRSEIGYTETYRGTAVVGGGKLCPAAQYPIPEHGAVRVELVQGSGSDQIVLSEVLWVVEKADMDALFAALEASHSECDGEEWMDSGDLKTFAVVAPPNLGDDSLAGLLRSGHDPELIREEHIVTFRQGDVLAEIALAEKVGDSLESTISALELHVLVSVALSKLPA